MTALLAKSKEELSLMLHILDLMNKLKINYKKIKVMVISYKE